MNAKKVYALLSLALILALAASLAWPRATAGSDGGHRLYLPGRRPIRQATPPAACVISSSACGRSTAGMQWDAAEPRV